MVRRMIHQNMNRPAQIIQISGASDGVGIAGHPPRANSRQYDRYAQRAIALFWANDPTSTVQRQAGLEAELSSLPHGYSCWEFRRPTPSTRRSDTRAQDFPEYEVCGHPNGKFKSMTDFYRHFDQLENFGNTANCTCTLCVRRRRLRQGPTTVTQVTAQTQGGVVSGATTTQPAAAQQAVQQSATQQNNAQPSTTQPSTTQQNTTQQNTTQQNNIQQVGPQQSVPQQNEDGVNDLPAPMDLDDILYPPTVALTVSPQPASPPAATPYFYQFHCMDPVGVPSTRVSFQDATREEEDTMNGLWHEATQYEFPHTFNPLQSTGLHDEAGTRPRFMNPFAQPMIPIDQYLHTAAAYTSSSGLFAPGLGPFSVPPGGGYHAQTAVNARYTLPDSGYATANPPTAVASPEQRTSAETGALQEMFTFDAAQGSPPSRIFNNNGVDAINEYLPSGGDAFERLLAQELENDRLNDEGAAEFDREIENEVFANFVEVYNENEGSTMITCDFCGQEHELGWACPEFDTLEYPTLLPGTQGQGEDEQFLDPQLR